MAFINKSPRTGTLEEVIGRHKDGSKLLGEADIFARIQNDCENSTLHWYVWYDLCLPLPVRDKQEIQIDFLLICEKGAIVLEVKGGRIQVLDGRYYWERSGHLEPMKITPFVQAQDYLWALLENNVLNRDRIFTSYAVAFPHQEMQITNPNVALDQSFWLWDKTRQDNKEESIADFFEDILDETKRYSSKGRYINEMSEDELGKVVAILSPTLEDKGRYSVSSLSEVLNWLHIDNLDILEGLSKNNRILIEGGPGTGKTTMAKAYVKKHKGLKGLYLCHNVLLAKKIEIDFFKEGLLNCEVSTYSKFLLSLGISEEHPLSHNELISKNHKTYDFIIIDEAQDIIDKGINVILDSFSSRYTNGLETGSYLVFYDIEQGYNSNFRRLDYVVSDLQRNAAHYKLNENKRVITNKLLVEIANRFLSLESEDEYINYLCELLDNSTPNLSITRTEDNKTLSIAFRNAINNSADKTNTVVLVHSDFKHIYATRDDHSMTLYEVLSCKPGIHILDEDDIENPDKSSIPFTSILRYKGLETNKVILVIPYKANNKNIDNFLFEIYVGFSRAMMELHVILHNTDY